LKLGNLGICSLVEYDTYLLVLVVYFRLLFWQEATDEWGQDLKNVDYFGGRPNGGKRKIPNYFGGRPNRGKRKSPSGALAGRVHHKIIVITFFLKDKQYHIILQYHMVLGRVCN
jgi:hypothetical protein